jgi:ABC-type lipoprotein export system ATPase subunit
MTARAHRGTRIIIASRDLHKTFTMGDRAIHALKQISMDIPAGQVVGIMGPSGSGKSTLLHLLGGLDRPTSGAVRVAGQRIDMLSGEDLAHFRRETVGFVFQSFHLIPTMTALDNVALPGIFAGMPRDGREQRAWRLLKLVGLTDRIEHRPYQLSGGQQQRVAIARALFNNPPIIMADEPTGALDSRTGEQIMKLLRALCRQSGKTVIVVTHDPTVASYTDRILNLKDGFIIGDHPPET